MTERATSTEDIRIKSILKAWADAVRRHEILAILAHHEADMVLFDLPPPLQCRGSTLRKDLESSVPLSQVCNGLRYTRARSDRGGDVAFGVSIHALRSRLVKHLPSYVHTSARLHRPPLATTCCEELYHHYCRKRGSTGLRRCASRSPTRSARRENVVGLCSRR